MTQLHWLLLLVGDICAKKASKDLSAKSCLGRIFWNDPKPCLGLVCCFSFRRKPHLLMTKQTHKKQYSLQNFTNFTKVVFSLRYTQYV